MPKLYHAYIESGVAHFSELNVEKNDGECIRTDEPRWHEEGGLDVNRIFAHKLPSPKPGHFITESKDASYELLKEYVSHTLIPALNNQLSTARNTSELLRISEADKTKWKK